MLHTQTTHFELVYLMLFLKRSTPNTTLACGETNASNNWNYHYERFPSHRCLLLELRPPLLRWVLLAPAFRRLWESWSLVHCQPRQGCSSVRLCSGCCFCGTSDVVAIELGEILIHRGEICQLRFEGRRNAELSGPLDFGGLDLSHKFNDKWDHNKKCVHFPKHYFGINKHSSWLQVIRNLMKAYIVPN